MRQAPNAPCNNKAKVIGGNLDLREAGALAPAFFIQERQELQRTTDLCSGFAGGHQLICAEFDYSQEWAVPLPEDVILGKPDEINTKRLYVD